MALSSINVTIASGATNASEVRIKNAAGGVPFPDLTNINAHVAAAVIVGTGDNAANVTAIAADVAALTSGMTGSVALIYDPAVLTTKNQGKAAMDAIAARLRAVGLL